MVNTNGEFLRETIASLGLQGTDRIQTVANATAIVTEVVKSYELGVGKGHVGINGNGIPDGFSRAGTGPNGLVYGRIQSGKTRAMIASTALAFDNGFRIALVMTSNINDLVSQTHLDF